MLVDAGRTELVDALVQVLEKGSPAIGRLHHADTSVTFCIDGEPTVTMLLDRSPVALVAPCPAEVTLSMDAELARAFARGDLAMTAAVVSGSVTASGPVRRYLNVDPIIRAALAERSGSERDSTEVRGEGRTNGPIASDLLAIETRDLHKSFGSNHVLRGLDIRIPTGSIAVVLGPSGTGKSVLLSHVIGVLKPDRGEVLIHGRALSSMNDREVLALRRDVGVMFQDGALFSALNVWDNVAFPLRQHTDMTEPEIREIVDERLASVGLLEAGGRMPNELSGGMRKRAGLARALVLSPAILLCDEPDSGLDPVRTALLGDLLVGEHADYGGTMVVVTHNIMLAKRIADHLSVVWRGEVLESGMASEVLASETPFIQQFLAGRSAGPLGMDA